MFTVYFIESAQEHFFLFKVVFLVELCSWYIIIQLIVKNSMEEMTRYDPFSDFIQGVAWSTRPRIKPALIYKTRL